MSQLYGEAHRSFQDNHGTRRLADRLESLAHVEFDANDRAFIESAAMFFLATVDQQGRPTVSYKGGAPGFVRITGASELVFPIFDGNGMFLSLGNIAGTADIGMLFIDLESPRRLRVQGTAEILPKDAMPGEYAGAKYLTRVRVSHLFVNCGRYIHSSRGQTLSPHVPDDLGRQPFPAWKRIDVIADSLNESDQLKVVAAGGAIPLEEYRGEGSADKTTTVD